MAMDLALQGRMREEIREAREVHLLVRFNELANSDACPEQGQWRGS